MNLIHKARIEKALDFMDDNFGEWKVVIQKNKDGKIKTHSQFPGYITDDTDIEESQDLTGSIISDTLLVR